jgi:hypothetical protein
LEPQLCKDILKEIERKPESERIFCYRLLNPSMPTFDGLIYRNQQKLEISEYIQCEEVMGKDAIISKQIGVIIGTSRLQAFMDTSKYLFYVLKKLLHEFLLYDKFNEDLFNKLYCDLEAFFYDDFVPVRDITPLFNFRTDIDTIQLGKGLTIRKITNDEKNILLDEAVRIGILPHQINAVEYVLKHKLTNIVRLYTFRNRVTLKEAVFTSGFVLAL